MNFSIPRRRLLPMLALPLLSCGLALADSQIAPLRIVTGDLPPFAVDGPGDRPGVLVELVEELLRRAGLHTRVEFYPWARAMQMAAEQPRVAILPLTRTQEREPRYQWLVKLYVQHFVFITRAGDPPVKTVEQARQMKVTVLRGSPNLAQLQRHQFNESLIAQANSVEDMLRLLDKGLVEAIYGGDAVNMDKVRSSKNRDPARYHVGMRLESGEVWLAGSSGFDDADRQRLRAAHQTMLKDGSIEKLFAAYNIKPSPEDLK